MIDIEFKRFYNHVKDPSWPDIDTYNDFLKLPSVIQKECYTLHDLGTRKQQMENLDHWVIETMHVYTHDNLIYMPLAKCASTYYIDFFTSIGWQPADFFPAIGKVQFGLVMHPFTRWVKGTTEFITRLYAENIHPYNVNSTDVFVESKLDWNRFVADYERGYLDPILNNGVILDSHAMPYHLQLGSYLDQVNWIPMDIFENDNDIKLCIMDLLKQLGHSISIPMNDQRAWRSSPEKQKIADIVKKHLATPNGRYYNLYHAFASDLKFYHNLLDTFDPSWKTLKFIK